MDRLYSFSDYEYAYYHMQWDKCIKIGKYLLSFIHNERAKELIKKLEDTHYEWDIVEEDSKELSELLFDVKLWIMTHPN